MTAAIILPPEYGTLAPPPVGASYLDPAFGTAITRETQAAMGSWIGTEYPSVDASDLGTLDFLLVEADHFGLWPAPMVDLPTKPASCEPRWSRTDPYSFYFHDPGGNSLLSCDVSAGEVATVVQFIDYVSISIGNGEGDVSEDGNHLAIIGTLPGGGWEVFVYNLATGVQGSILSVPDAQPIDSAYITPDNNVLISWEAGGTARFQGMELFDGNMNFLRQIANANGHKGTARDAAGKECLIWTNSDENPATLSAFPNGIVSIDLATGNQKGLLSLDWSLAVHISARPGLDFAIVETYAGPTITPESGWAAYTNELLQVPLDGSPVTRLCHHRSVQGSYNAQPKATISRDGKRLLFSSNFNQQPANPDYIDVYSVGVKPLPVAPRHSRALRRR